MVLEITERALAARPAELLRTVERVRALGWGIALDDVGADSMSLAFLPLLAPDVVKLDLRLVQERPGPAIAEIMNAVNAHAERTGALVLAEGIETEEHLATARALGATLGQGWLLRPPGPGRRPRPARPARWPCRRPPPPRRPDASPFACLPDTVPLRRSAKSLLIELSKQLEREAMRLGETCVVAATFQEARHFTPSTIQRYRDLVERTGLRLRPRRGPARRAAARRPRRRAVARTTRCAASGTSSSSARTSAPRCSPATSATTGPTCERTFEYALTYDRDTVIRAAHALLTAGRAAHGGAAPPRVAASGRRGPGRRRPARRSRRDGDALLRSALAATTSGVTIADMRLPDQPLVYVNEAFEQLAGLTARGGAGPQLPLPAGPGHRPGRRRPHPRRRSPAARSAGRRC